MSSLVLQIETTRPNDFKYFIFLSIIYILILDISDWLKESSALILTNHRDRWITHTASLICHIRAASAANLDTISHAFHQYLNQEVTEQENTKVTGHQFKYCLVILLSINKDKISSGQNLKLSKNTRMGCYTLHLAVP